MKTNERRLKAKSFMTKMETVLSVSGVPVVRGCKCNSRKMGVSLFSAVPDTSTLRTVALSHYTDVQSATESKQPRGERQTQCSDTRSY